MSCSKIFSDKRSQIDDSLLLLLQKSGNYLENFGFNSDYIMKKKKVKLLAIKNTFTTEHHMKSGDLSNSKDELEEFKFYNIRVQSYNELFIDINTFIMDID
ncbi:hypothetical protein C1646_741616 [Rhizophagus diaphanus]|nr:hypothetical protein C1646_741616 [Rhizophagus diaphanus] [Rhizophagus sp. MUCL 43196]